jgi:hypothetical protein
MPDGAVNVVAQRADPPEPLITAKMNKAALV